MKPTLYKFQGLWYCRSINGGKAGLGYTPGDAYREWMQRNQGVACDT